MNTPSPEVRERLERWMARGNRPGGMNVPDLDGTPSIQADLRTLLAQSTEQAARIEALMAEIARLRSPGVWQELMAADARRVLGDPMQGVSGPAIEEWPL